MSIEKTIVEDLSELGFPVFQQGSWPGDVELPETFITFDIVDSTDIAHYGNVAFAVEWQLQFNVYAIDPDVLDSTRESVIQTLVAKNYTRDGRGYGGEIEKRTGRFPWYLMFYKFEKESE